MLTPFLTGTPLNWSRRAIMPQAQVTSEQALISLSRVLKERKLELLLINDNVVSLVLLAFRLLPAVLIDSVCCSPTAVIDPALAASQELKSNALTVSICGWRKSTVQPTQAKQIVTI